MKLVKPMDKLLRDQGFLIHLIVYISVMILLFIIDMMTSPGSYWFQWPLLGWGIGVLGHGFLAYQQIRRRQPGA
ncbi:MAG: 2TM domain-containing protein [Alphaproteobacteria bacterium]|nr:2TM domain-containing protein [Alphaproteobacteria bacterium]